MSGQLRLWFIASTTATAKYEEDCPADSAHGSHVSHVKEVDSANVSWESVFAQKVAAAAHMRLRPSGGAKQTRSRRAEKAVPEPDTGYRISGLALLVFPGNSQ
eukprot:scaffold13590_cov101-Isochrysis_galbana.AAC.4